MNHAIHSLPSLTQVVKTHQLLTKKSLGQNFLLDLNLTDRIARAAGALEGQTVLEIGPGPGGLTRALLLNGAEKVIVIERDARCIPLLEELKAVSDGRLFIIEEDALVVDEPQLFEQYGVSSPVKIVANLPYNIGTELLFKWLENLEYFSSITLTLQKEVVDRITAAPGTKARGRLSVMSQWLCHAEKQFDISPAAFYPPPKVTSAVVRLTPRSAPIAEVSFQYLSLICKMAFGQRRKTLRSSLKQLNIVSEQLFQMAEIDSNARPEVLTLEQWGRLTSAYSMLTQV